MFLRRSLEIPEKEVTRNRDKGYILDKDIKDQDDQFNIVTKFIVKREWKKYPRILRINTYNYNLSHICRVKGLQYLWHLYVDKMMWCKCPIS